MIAGGKFWLALILARDSHVCHVCVRKTGRPEQTYYVRRNLLHLGCRRSRSRVELVDKQAGESVELHQVQRLPEVFLRLTGEPADDVCGDGYTRDPKRESEALLE